MLTLALAFVLSTPAPAPAVRQDQVRTDFVALFEGREKEGLLELWRENPGAILVTIDADLEGALGLWEKQPDAPDTAGIAERHERALWGAQTATELTGNPIFADYAASFVGWDADQKRSFRAGQKAFGAARRALGAGDAEAALAAARDCIGRAGPLGDWWGLAMGLQAEGDTLALLGEHAAAAFSLARARQVNHDLGLTGAEYGCSVSLARLLADHGPRERARAAVSHAIALAVALGDEAGQGELMALRKDLAR
ncbi:MAG TPA: hypothetical protein VMT18_13570 [Planctomycetota bacterium]|nr:hypothetical protein [Planctomycetota bacterium]